MPRARIKTAEPVVTVKPLYFTPAIKDELVNLLGYDMCGPEQARRSDQAVAQTARAAANYLGAAELAPKLPRSANIHAEVKAFLKKGDFSAEKWRNLHPWTQRELSQSGMPNGPKENNPRAIASACERYLQSNPIKPTGRPRLEHRARLIKALCRIFHGYGTRKGINDGLFDGDGPGLTERSRRGSVTSYSPLEQDRYEFVRAVFSALGIPVYKDLHEDIFIQANMPDEYARRMNIIASRSRRRRKKLNQPAQSKGHMYLFPDG